MQEPLRVSVQSHGAMNALAEPLRSTNSQVQSRAALLVAALGCDADARAEVKAFFKAMVVYNSSES